MEDRGRRARTLDVMTRIGIVVAHPQPAGIETDTLLDAAPLVDALTRRGAHAETTPWRDPSVDWASFDLLVIRSPWDYMLHEDEFARWLDLAASSSRVLNEPELVRWNMDKRYLAQLEQAGVGVIPASYHHDRDTFARALADIADGMSHVVVKPTVGAGSQLVGLFAADDPAALDLGEQILASGGVVMLQPEVQELSDGKEKALYAIDGHVTHAISKGALLARGGGLRGGVYQERPVVVGTTEQERAFAERVLSAISEVTGLPTPLYGRIDTVGSAEHGLVLLEAELFEPLFNLPLVPEVTEAFADAILARA
jgi:glutathione synthase/RimK-type ligase-like ATP-grasp enzyme